MELQKEHQNHSPCLPLVKKHVAPPHTHTIGNVSVAVPDWLECLKKLL